MSKCLYCYKELSEGMAYYHPSCSRKFFGSKNPPVLPYTRSNMSELAKRVISASTAVTGVQAKMSLNIDRGKKNEPAKLTIVGLWGKYIFKPQASKYRSLPELEHLTMKMASVAGIRTVEHSLIPMADGELGYITKRIDRDENGRKLSMLDFCQLSNRLTEHKYYGTYPQLAQTIQRFSSAPILDVQRFWEIVLFSWITGNSDMHCKNFALIEIAPGEYELSPAYDLLAVLLADIYDKEELAMPLTVGGRKNGFTRESFISAMTESGITGRIAALIITKLCSFLPQWDDLIDDSFLPDDMKSAYHQLLRNRLERLGEL